MAVRTRGKANESLHFARVLLRAWDVSREHSTDSPRAVRAAFMPAVKFHLEYAYGWFLMAVSGEETTNQPEPPFRVAALSPPPAGRMAPPELSEFALLEATGWIGDMLSPDIESPPSSSPAGGASSLLVSDQGPADYALAMDWALRLEGIMARIDDSMAEC